MFDSEGEIYNKCLYCPAVPFNIRASMPRIIFLVFESVVEILTRDHLNESYGAVLSQGAVPCIVQRGSNFYEIQCDHLNECY